MFFLVSPNHTHLKENSFLLQSAITDLNRVFIRKRSSSRVIISWIYQESNCPNPDLSRLSTKYLLIGVVHSRRLQRQSPFYRGLCFTGIQALHAYLFFLLARAFIPKAGRSNHRPKTRVNRVACIKALHAGDMLTHCLMKFKNKKVTNTQTKTAVARNSR